MSVTETYEPELIETDGVETDFDFDFSVFANTDVVVATVDPTTLVATAKTLGVDYTVTLNTSTVGGTVVFGTAPADNLYVSIRRDIPLTQGTDIPSGGLFREVQIENALDKAILLIQQLQEQVDRALLQNPYSTAIEIVWPLPEASKLIGWNTAGDGLENYTASEAAAAEVLAEFVADYLATQAEAEAGTENTKYMTALRTKQAITANAPADVLTAVLTSGATVATNAALVASGGVFTLTAAESFTLSNPTNPVDGKKLVWRIKQDATGSRVLTFGNKFKVASNVEDGTIVLSTAANVIDMIGAIYNSTSDIWSVVAFARNITAVT